MSKILRMSEAGSLALHAAVLLAGSDRGRMSVPEMASRLNASEAHLSKVLQRLSKARIVRSARGPGGGFELARPPEEVTLLEVYEAIEGPLVDANCLFAVRICGSNQCILGDFIWSVHAEVRRRLSATRLSDVASVFEERTQ